MTWAQRRCIFRCVAAPCLRVAQASGIRCPARAPLSCTQTLAAMQKAQKEEEEEREAAKKARGAEKGQHS